jgi:hypothetical protein
MKTPALTRIISEASATEEAKAKVEKIMAEIYSQFGVEESPLSAGDTLRQVRALLYKIALNK